MKRPLLLAAIAAAGILGALLPAAGASASPVSTPAPLAVRVVGSADTATVSWTAPSAPRLDPIVGYSVTISPTEKQPRHGVDVVGARTLSDRFGSLTAGRTYTFAVRTIGLRGTSVAATTTYTRPLPHVESLYALNGTGALVRRPVTGGTWTTIAAAGAGYGVDASGTAYVPTADGTRIIAYPETGTSRVVASGLTSIGQVRADLVGDVFYVQSGSVMEIPKGTSSPRAIVPTRYSWAVAPNGTVASAATTTAVTIATLTGTTRTVDMGDPYYSVFVSSVDQAGNVYFSSHSPGASGSYFLGVIPSGTSTPTGLVGADAISAVSPNGNWYGLQTTTWCNSPSRGAGCVEDTSVKSELRRTSTGVVTNVAISGLQIGLEGYLSAAAADSAGEVFVAVPTGPNAGLARIPAAGGPVQQLDAAPFSDLTVQ